MGRRTYEVGWNMVVKRKWELKDTMQQWGGSRIKVIGIYEITS